MSKTNKKNIRKNQNPAKEYLFKIELNNNFDEDSKSNNQHSKFNDENIDYFENQQLLFNNNQQIIYTSENQINNKNEETNNNSDDVPSKIDIRMQFTKSTEESQILFRDLTPLELKRIKNNEKSETQILEIHSELPNQEQLFCNLLSTDFSIIYQIENLKTKLMEYQKYGISWMKERERSITKGGILADEMGMGKTVQAIGLMLADDFVGETLIITPAIALNQWIFEIEKHAPFSFEILNYHGRGKKEILKNNIEIHTNSNTYLENENDNESFLLNDNKILKKIILTTYGTVESEYRKKNGFLFEKKFRRIILDEAHYIKDSKSNTSTAIMALNSDFRWGLTGTPVQNRVGDLYSLVRFLRLDPHSFYFCKKCDCKSLKWLNYDKKNENVKRGFCTCGHFSASHFSWWNRRIANPIKEFGYTKKGKEIFDNLNKITSHIILRRTKQKLEKELGLPSKIVSVIRNYFSEQEKDFYKSLYTQSQLKFKSYAIKGEINNNYAHIFELLQKMRLAVNHPFLAMKDVNEGIPICGFCNEEANDPIISKCRHIFCREEARSFLSLDNTCPVCKVKITIDLNQEEDFSVKKSFIQPNHWTSSTKIECLVEELSLLKNKENLTKSIVFSQFVNFLELLRWRLERAGFRCVTIYGSMTLGQRKAAIEAFNTNKEITVFLISLKAGGVALNLTEASRVFLMDLWWNPAVEEQAMDRIHRIGQHRPIRINRIIIEDSIESRILALQEKKKALFDSAVDNDINALQRLSEQDLTFLFS
ncbi:DNA repair protein rad16 [Gurleya vavrai]